MLFGGKIHCERILIIFSTMLFLLFIIGSACASENASYDLNINESYDIENNSDYDINGDDLGEDNSTQNYDINGDGLGEDNSTQNYEKREYMNPPI